MAANAQFNGALPPAPRPPRPAASLRIRRLSAPCRAADIGQQFTDHYYRLFDDPAQRAQLAPLYGDQSCLTYEKEQFMGAQSIMTKLTVRGSNSAHARDRLCLPSICPGTPPLPM